jgi:class 3 adenylate cyclase
MHRPAELNPAWATELLDVVTQPWEHAADAIVAACEAATRRSIPLAYVETRVPLPHPILRRGRAVWTPETGGVWILDTDEGRIEESETERRYAGSPLRSGSASTRQCLIDALDPSLLARVEHADLDPLHAPLVVEVADFAASVLLGIEAGGPTRALMLCATRSTSGFLPSMRADLHALAWAFSSVARQFRWRGVAHTVATTYIGPTTGRKVLAGQVKLGEVERRDAVVWFSDLRGFTSMSTQRSAEDVVARINVMFEHVAGAIHDEGGEVLKLIGDAVLAIFPYRSDDEAADATQRALRAAQRVSTLPLGLEVGIGLHRGEVAYGNVGAPDRLDFTVIGRTVNVASRVEHMTSVLHEPLLASAEIAACAPEAFVSVGQHALKGIPEAIELFAHRRA